MTGVLGEYRALGAIRFDSADGAFWRFAMEPMGDGGTDAHAPDGRGPDDARVRGTVSRRCRQGVEPGRHGPAGTKSSTRSNTTLTGLQPPDIDYPSLCRFYDRGALRNLSAGARRDWTSVDLDGALL